jgi:hypothetical protein
MKGPKLVTLPGGKKAYRGTCVVCGHYAVYKQGYVTSIVLGNNRYYTIRYSKKSKYNILWY